MKSLRQQLLVLVLGPLLILSLSMAVMIGLDSNQRAKMAAVEKAKSDLATAEAIINLKHPGPWEIRNGDLYKGNAKMSGNLELVDYLSDLTGDTVTIFLGDTRVATTVRKENGERAIGTKVSDSVANAVLKNGQIYTGEANVIGQKYLTAYKPISDKNKNIVGIFYVGINKKLADEMLKDSILTIVITSSILTILVGVVAFYITQRKIVGPLQQITRGTQKIATGGLINKVEVVSGENEITELAKAFNQLVDGIDKLTEKINLSERLNNSERSSNSDRTNNSISSSDKLATFIENEPALDIGLEHEGDLPKGINESTLKQILAFMKSKEIPMSAEEVGEEVNLTRVTVRRYLEFLEQLKMVEVELKYGTVGRPVKLYKVNTNF